MKNVLTIEEFSSNLKSYEQTITDLLGTKYGITAIEFMSKCVNAVKKNTELLKCTKESLFGSIMYFAEVGLCFDTPEGFGYISTSMYDQKLEATPLIGYKGLIEIAYRNPKVKSIRFQSVYENDNFDYEYGTNEFLTHKPTYNGIRGELKCVYAIAQLSDISPMFVVVHKEQLNDIQKLSETGTGKKTLYGNKADVFNLMQAKVAIKLLFKTLPKTDNDALIKTLELDNKFDYEKNMRIIATQNGYELVEKSQRLTAMSEVELKPLEIKTTEKFNEKVGTKNN